MAPTRTLLNRTHRYHPLSHPHDSDDLPVEHVGSVAVTDDGLGTVSRCVVIALLVCQRQTTRRADYYKRAKFRH